MRLPRQIFCDNGRIELGHGCIRQPVPDLILAEQGDAEIAAHRERLTVRTEGHLGVVDLAVARIKEIPSHGAFLRSSVHCEQTGLGSSPGSGKVFAITPSKMPL